MLRVTERLANNVPGRPYAEWIKVCLETNKPYDQMVYEMLTAEGKVFDNPAAGYMPPRFRHAAGRHEQHGAHLPGDADRLCPVPRPSLRSLEAERVLPDGRLHGRHADAARARDPQTGKNMVASLREDLKKVDSSFDGGGKYNRFLQGNLMEVWDNNNKLRLPHDYDYENAKAGDVVAAKAIFDPPAQISSGETPRVAFARWLTSPENPRFAKTIANRLWKKAFGVGQIEPVDDHEGRQRGGEPGVDGAPHAGDGAAEVRHEGVSADRAEHQGLAARVLHGRARAGQAVSFPRPRAAADDGRAGVGLVRDAGRSRSGRVPDRAGPRAGQAAGRRPAEGHGRAALSSATRSCARRPAAR